MRSIMTKGIVLVVGIVLFALMLVPVTSSPVSAGPLLAITETPQEPPPPTSPPPTSPPPTSPPPTSLPSGPTSPPSEPTSPPNKPTSTPKPHNSPDPGAPDVSIIKTVDQSSAKRGDLMGFTLHINNEGSATAKDVVVTDNVPSYLKIQDYSVSKGTVSVSGQTIVANVGTLSTGEYVTVRFRAYISADAPETGSNTGTVTDSNGDSNPNNNSSTVTFTVPTSPSPTPIPPTEVPAPPAPTAEPPAPAPAPQRPAPKPPVREPAKAQKPPVALPHTGDGDDQTMMLTALMLIGLSGLGIGWAVRRRAQR